MIKSIKKQYYTLGVALTMGAMVMPMDAAHAKLPGGGAGNTFSTISNNITTSLASLPGLVSGLSYLCGITIGVLGIFKIKDHVENPSQTPLKEGAIRLGAGGALLTMPMIYDAMINSIGAGTAPVVNPLNVVSGATIGGAPAAPAAP